MALSEPALHHFEVADYLRLVQASPDMFEGTELLEGVIVDVSPESWAHAELVRFLDDALGALTGGRSRRNGSVMFESRTLRQPDVYVVGDPAHIGEYPVVADIELVVEVAFTTRTHDLTTKAALYAASGVPRYWVVEPAGAGIVVTDHRHPTDGRYTTIDTVAVPTDDRSHLTALLKRP